MTNAEVHTFQLALSPSYPLHLTKGLLLNWDREPFAIYVDIDLLSYPGLIIFTGSDSLIFFQFFPLFNLTDLASILSLVNDVYFF